MKVALIHNIVSPYRIPIFEGLSNTPEMDLTVFYCAKTHKIREWKIIESDRYISRFLSGITIEFRDFVYHVNYEIIPIILKKQFDVIIIGGSSDFTTQIAFILSKIVHTPIILWSEGITPPQGLAGKIAQPLFEYIIRHSDAIIVPGSASKKYHTDAGADQNHIFIAPNIVDNDYFLTQSTLFIKGRDQIKKEMKIDGKKVVIYVGQLIPRKGVDHLIRAFTLVNESIPDSILLIVGNGPVKEELKELCAVSIRENVVFTGWVDDEEKVKYYSVADVFVFPSLFDVWGLVVNEAMCCGLPVISTDAAGCAADLVVDGENGFLIKPGDSKGLADSIKRIIENPDLRDRMGEKSLEIITKKFNQKECVRGFTSAITFVKNSTYSSQP